MSCCSADENVNLLENVVSVDERGQLVLPKDLREKWNIKPGDKLAILTCVKGGEICCATLVKADLLTRNLQLKFDWTQETQPSK